MLRSSRYEIDLFDVPRHADQDGRRPQPGTAARRLAATLRAIVDAWRESLAAHRQYERLRARGIPHDRALGEALGVPPTRCHKNASLYFAGRA
jgi:hypothetical protein